MKQVYDDKSNAFYASARLWDDGIINPLDTRKVISFCLTACFNAPIKDTTYGVFRM